MHKAMWMPLRKSEQGIVEGYASSEDPDSTNDLLTTQAIKKALPGFMKWAAVREMHKTSAVGTVLKAEIIDGEVEIDGEVYHNPLHVVAKIVDRDAWEKVKQGVYKGFSLGGDILRTVPAQMAGKLVRKITEIDWVELSLADRPVHPGARILLWKAERKGVTGMRKRVQNTRALNKADDDMPAGTTPEQVIALLQALRNDVEVGGDLEKAEMYTNAIALVLQAEGAEEAVVAEPAEEAAEEHEELGEEPPVDLEGAEGAPETPAEEAAESAETQDDEDRDDRELRAAARTRRLHKSTWVTPEALQKAVNAQSAQLEKTLGTLTKTLTAIDTRLQRIEAQPRSGGPVLRAVDKTIAGQAAPADPEREQKQQRLSDLRKAAAVEPDPLRRAQYQRDVLSLEAELNRK